MSGTDDVIGKHGWWCDLFINAEVHNTCRWCKHAEIFNISISGFVKGWRVKWKSSEASFVDPEHCKVLLSPLFLNKNFENPFGYAMYLSSELSAATQEFITATKGSKTHSSLRQSNLKQQNEPTLMSARIRAIEHMCAAGLAGAHPGLQDRILLNYTTKLPTCLHQKKPEKPRWQFWGIYTQNMHNHTQSRH